MEILLKILLFLIGLLSIGFGYFLIDEYKSFIKSSEYDESSIYHKILIFLLFFLAECLVILISGFSLILTFCDIKIIFPW